MQGQKCGFLLLQILPETVYTDNTVATAWRKSALKTVIWRNFRAAVQCSYPLTNQGQILHASVNPVSAYTRNFAWNGLLYRPSRIITKIPLFWHFLSFQGHVATYFTNHGQIWHARADPWCDLPCQILPTSHISIYSHTQSCKFDWFLNFWEERASPVLIPYTYQFLHAKAYPWPMLTCQLLSKLVIHLPLRGGKRPIFNFHMLLWCHLAAYRISRMRVQDY